MPLCITFVGKCIKYGSKSGGLCLLGHYHITDPYGLEHVQVDIGLSVKRTAIDSDSLWWDGNSRRLNNDINPKLMLQVDLFKSICHNHVVSDVIKNYEKNHTFFWFWFP